MSDSPFILVTKARLGLVAAALGLLGAVGGGIARVEMGAAKLDDVAARTVKLESADQDRAIRMSEISTKLDDVKDVLHRIEDRLDAQHASVP